MDLMTVAHCDLAEAFEVAHNLLRHYASLLNQYDGGRRRIPEDVGKWVQQCLEPAGQVEPRPEPDNEPEDVHLEEEEPEPYKPVVIDGKPVLDDQARREFKTWTMYVAARAELEAMTEKYTELHQEHYGFKPRKE